MLCVVDVGNTHTVLGLFESARLVERWRIRTDPERTTDEWGLMLRDLAQLASVELAQVSSMAISSVVPQAVHALRRAGERYLTKDPLVIGPGVKTGLAISYDNPREVGADRVANAVAAYERVGGACIVVDFGTATTFDCISSEGKYLGGAIAPGLKISLEALVSRTAKLPRVEIARPRSVIGRNTEESIQAGILYGYSCLVDGLVEKLSAEMGGVKEVIATGGLARVIAAESRSIGLVEPNLTLEGLRLIHQRNSQ